MSQPTVADWMTPDPITVPRGTDLATARATMHHEEVRRLLVVDQEGNLEGIVTWGDVLEAWPSPLQPLEPVEVRELMARVLVDEIMTEDVFTVDPETTIAEAASLLFEHHIGALPVLQDGRVVGIVTGSDLVQGLVRILAERA